MSDDGATDDDAHAATDGIRRVRPRGRMTAWLAVVAVVLAAASVPRGVDADAFPQQRLREPASSNASDSASGDGNGTHSGSLDVEACRASCATIHRTTAGCAISTNGSVSATCGACLAGFDGAANATAAPCVVDNEYWNGPTSDDDNDDDDASKHGSGKGYEYGEHEGSKMSMQASLASALGSIVLLLMCIITWRGWLDCCSRRREAEPLRAFMKTPTKEWECAVCLHDNSPLRRYCIMCKTEFQDNPVDASSLTAPTPEGDSHGDGSAYILVETPRAAAASRSRPFSLEEEDLTDEQRVASERLEWKRCINRGTVRWLRFRAADVRRHAVLRGAILDTKNLTSRVLKDAVRWCPASRGVRSAPPVDGFFVLIDNQAATAWAPVDAATFDSRPYKHWRGLQKIAAMPFEERLRWFYQEILKLRHPMIDDKYTIHVHREHILKQSMQLFETAPSSSLRRHLRVDFMDEPGVDGGGILREWLQLVCRDLFSDAQGAFKRTVSASDGGYWINRSSVKRSRNQLQMYTFFGQLLAKVLLEGLVLNVRLAIPLLKHLLDSPLSREDIRYLDEQIYSSINYILTHDGIDELCLTFCVDGQDLITRGSETAVTDANKQLYVDHLVQFYLFDSVERELTCITKGFRSILPDKLRHIFDFKELDLVLSGLAEIDVLDWQSNTNVCVLGHHVDQEQQVIDWFWEIMEEMDQRGRSKLLQYVTGSSGVPVEGFAALTSLDGRLQPFTIQLTENVPKSCTVMPYASTCFNRLDLPVYQERDDLKEMLRLLVEMDVTGFNRR